MAWRGFSAVDQRVEFVRLASLPGARVSELCRRFGISRSNGHKWLKRYREAGEAGLEEHSRRPLSSPRQTSRTVETAVLLVRQESNGAWGGRKIRHALIGAGSDEVPAASTITEILRRNGQLDARPGEHPGPFQRFEREQPNDLWQMDFKGHIPAGSGRCHPLTVLDDHSRYALVLEACSDQRDRTVRDRLTTAFRRYGLPSAMLMDNGSPWGDAGDQPWTSFGIWLCRLGVRVIHGRPYHPQTQGKEERFHRTLKAEVLAGNSFADLCACQRAFDQWRPRYNHKRPHEALGMAVPADRYRPSLRSFPETLPPIEYGPGDEVRTVDPQGCISFQSDPWRIGKPFKGLKIALRPTQQDGLWDVRFCSHVIGQIDQHADKAGARGQVTPRPRRDLTSAP